MAVETDLRSVADDEEALLSRVAWYYHHDGLTQHEVGRRLGLSRIKVSRLLEKGKRTGIIGITIHSPHRGCLALETRLRETYGLNAAIVIPPLEPGADDPIVHVNERLAQAAASYLMNFLREGGLLAIGWGDTVTRTLNRLGYLLGNSGASVVTLTGGVSTYLHMIGGLNAALGQAHRLAMIPSPLVVSDAATAAALLREPAVRDVLALTTNASFALIGIGAMNENASFVRGGYVSTADMERYRRQGAVGDVLGRFFDESGAVLDLELHDRIVGIDLDTLAALPFVIGVAGGPQKVAAIRGVLARGALDMLITDEPTARAVLG
jgi:lsr operon transcriptional repressor